ncbi:MAG: hypothetical protein WCC39_18060 [Telluria sp.]
MRTLLTLLAASTLLASSAIAAPIAADTPQQASAQQMADAVGTYKLSDNRRADIVTREGQLYIRIGRSPQKELVLAGQNRYTTRDGSIAIQFVPDANNDRIVLQHERGIGQPDAIRLASNQPIGRGSAD